MDKQETLRTPKDVPKEGGNGKGRVDKNRLPNSVVNKGDTEVKTAQKEESVISQETLLNPSPLFKRLEPNPDKIKEIARHLMENKYSLSDELRDYDIIHGILRKYMMSNVCIFYEIGDMDGIFGFTDIIPGWKAHVVFELINPKIWRKQLVRESRGLVDLVMKAGELIKLSSQTADTRVKRMSEMIGFHLEGVRELEFSWDNKPYPIYLIGRFRR